MDSQTAQKYLVDLLQRAHAGELAAAYAYRGHSASVSNAIEKSEIKEIEEDEWAHRRRIGEMLAELHAKPRLALEFIFGLIGRTVAFCCHVGGWFVPMYGAGKLERGNIVEYEVAARLARVSGQERYVQELLEFAAAEWRHERYYREKVKSHWLHRYFGVWPEPPAQERIQESFAEFAVTKDFSTLATAVFTVNRVSRYRV